MLTKLQNDSLTQTGPGTPGGDLLRRYWQPVALAEELPPGDSAPRPLRVLSEDLVLLRDDSGRPALRGPHSSQRRAGVSYPCQEAGGLILAYLGPGKPPLLPAYEFLQAPPDHRWMNKIEHECNYLQANEGNIDPVHLSFLHRLSSRRDKIVRGSDKADQELFESYQAPLIEIEETSFGLRIATIRNPGGEDQYLRVSYFIFPNLAAFPGSTGGDGYGINWHVPIDDTHHWKYQISYKRSTPIDNERFRRDDAAEMLPGYQLRRTRANRYLQDRDEMRASSFIGMGTVFAVHDKFATEGEGPIQDRTVEHLSYTDKAIAWSRRGLLSALTLIQAGSDPPHVVRSPGANHFEDLLVLSEMVPNGIDWRDHLKRALDARRAVPA